jgi:pimeloyl-ACP methyl ester carboxylesterase
MATYVFIHGAFQGGWIWKYVATPLRAAGHLVYTPTMDGCGERAHQIRPEISMEGYVKEVAELLYFEDLKDVILVGTSTGGLAASYIAENAEARIGHLVFIEALLPLPGERIRDLLVPVSGGSGSGAKWEATKLAYGPPKEFINGPMLADVDPEIRAFAAERFRLYPFSATPAVTSETTFWDKTWKATVINCTKSTNPADSHQYRSAEKLNAKLIELDANHYPMLSHPKELTEILLTIAKEL